MESGPASPLHLSRRELMFFSECAWLFSGFGVGRGCLLSLEFLPDRLYMRRENGCF
jgi:hypothetical protein